VHSSSNRRQKRNKRRSTSHRSQPHLTLLETLHSAEKTSVIVDSFFHSFPIFQRRERKTRQRHTQRHQSSQSKHTCTQLTLSTHIPSLSIKKVAGERLERAQGERVCVRERSVSRDVKTLSTQQHGRQARTKSSWLVSSIHRFIQQTAEQSLNRSSDYQKSRKRREDDEGND